jgi:hypothetical protein
VHQLIDSIKMKLDRLPKGETTTSGAVVSEIKAELDEIERLAQQSEPVRRRRLHPWVFIAAREVADKLLAMMEDTSPCRFPHTVRLHGYAYARFRAQTASPSRWDDSERVVPAA